MAYNANKGYGPVAALGHPVVSGLLISSFLVESFFDSRSVHGSIIVSSSNNCAFDSRFLIAVLSIVIILIVHLSDPDLIVLHRYIVF